jgi:hypothetical protein
MYFFSVTFVIAHSLNIVKYLGGGVRDLKMGFGLMTGFIAHLYILLAQ